MATIIRRENHIHESGSPLRGVAYEFCDLDGRAQDFIDAVEAEAVKIVQDAKQKAAQIRKDAEAAGRKAAQDAIEKILDEKVARQMATLTPAIAKAVEQIDDARADWIRHWESSVVVLACGIARRIIHREIAQQPDLPLEWIGEALEMCTGAGEIVVRLHPTEIETIGRQVDQLAAAFGPKTAAVVLPDETVGLGGCRIETQFGTIDQQIESQLARVQEELG